MSGAGSLQGTPALFHEDSGRPERTAGMWLAPELSTNGVHEAMGLCIRTASLRKPNGRRHTVWTSSALESRTNRLYKKKHILTCRMRTLMQMSECSNSHKGKIWQLALTRTPDPNRFMSVFNLRINIHAILHEEDCGLLIRSDQNIRILHVYPQIHTSAFYHRPL